MRIAICDDEILVQQILEEKVKGLFPDAVIERFTSGDEFIASGCKPDILFLDIQMPGKNGIKTAKAFRLDNLDTIIIFITALGEYVYDAFDVGAFHYLIKPIDDMKFIEVLKKAVEQKNKQKIQKSETEEPFLLIKYQSITRKILLKDIVYAEVFNRKIFLHMKNETIEYYGKLKEIESVTKGSFFRTHRAYLVNLKYVSSYESGKVYMKDKEVLLSKSNYSAFVKAFLHYHRRDEG